MRLVDQKGLGEDKDMRWLVQDFHEELKSWGRPGGVTGRLIMKSDSEKPIVALCEALAKLHGGSHHSRATTQRRVRLKWQS